MAKSLRKKLEENGKLESAMSYADIKTSTSNSNKIAIPQNNPVSFKDRVEARAQNIINNTNTSRMDIIKTTNTIKQNERNKKKQDNIEKFKQYNREYAKKANETMENGNIVQKAGAVAGNVGRGFVVGATTGFGDIFATATNVATLAGNALGIKTVQQNKKGRIDGKEFVDDYKTLKEIENEYSSKLEGIVNSGAYRLSAVAGNMLPAATTGAMFGYSNLPEKTVEGIRKVTSALSSGASAYLDTLDEEQTNGIKSALKGALYGFATYKIEGITGGNFISKHGSLDDLAIKGISKFKNEFSKKIASSVYEATGEAIEENVENMADHLIDYAFGDGKDLSLKGLIEEAGQTTADTMALNFIMQALGLGGGTYNDVKMNEANQKIDNANISDVSKEALREVVEKEGNPNVVDYLLNKKTQRNAEQIEYQQATTQNNDISQDNQQVIPQEQNQAQNANMKQAEATQQRSEKYNKFKQQLAENGLNYDDKRANVMFDLPNKREIDVEVNAEAFKKADGSINSNINAMYVTDAEGKRKIIYNPNANLDTVIEKNTIHEVVHDLEGSKKEYSEINKMVLNKIENTPEYQEAYNSFEEAYSKVTDSEGRILYNKDSAEFKEMIKQEVVADYLGENLGNQEYINELVNGKESRNIAQKIYDAIVSFLDKVTGYKSEEAYLRGLKNKFEKAFNAEYSNQGEKKKYSFAGVNSKTVNYTNLAVAEGLERQGKTVQEIYEQTGWYRGNENKWRYEIDDSNFAINNNVNRNQNYKLKDIIQNADELYSAYPQLKNAIVYFTDLPLNVARGYSETYDNYLINNNLVSNNDELKKTLMHEIQHNIQAIEDFSRGSSDNWQEIKTKIENKLTDIDKQIDNINQKIGFETYKDSLLKTYFANGKFNSNEYFKKLENFQNNSKYAEQIQRLKAQKKAVEDTYGNIKNRSNEDLYESTAGEKEAQEVEKRLDMTSKERKKQLPFVKDKKTVYNIKDRLPYIFNNNKYELFLKEDIVSGKDGFYIDGGNEEYGYARDKQHISGGSRTGKNEYIYRQVMGSEATNKREDIQNIGRDSSKSVGLENNSSSFSIPSKVQDNQGRQLSKEQQEYFKDSKVRDEKGNLLTVYHGTPYEFNQFKYDKLGENTSSLGAGFYFTDKIETAEEYKREGGNVKTVYLDIKKPLKYMETTITKAEYQKFIKAIDKETNGTYLTDYDGIENALMEYDYGGDDIDLVSAVQSASGLSYEKTFEILRNSIGYDGIISDVDFLNKGERLYIAFNSNQIKNTDNINPTENPDIRYSQNDSKWQEFLDKNSLNDGTTTTLGELKASQKQDNNTIEKIESKENSFNAPSKAKNYEQRQRNTFKKNMSNMLGISQFNQNNKALFDTSLNQLRAEYNQRGRVSEEVRNDIFNNLYNNLLKEDKAFYDENKDIKDNIRSTKLYIDNKTKQSIVDYDEFRKSAIGSAILTNDDSNIPIDSYYKELNELNSSLFPDSITNTSEQLQRIVEVSKSIRKSERNIAEYADKYMAKEYRQYAQQEFSSYVDNLEKEYKTVDRYTQDRIKQSQKEEYVAPDLQEIRGFYENRSILQKEIEKQEKNLLLTQREKAVVDRLLKDEMDVNEILPGLNKEAIIKSYTARQQLDYLKQGIKEYKANVKQNLKDVADSWTVDADTWKDKKWGLFYERETAIRNMQDIMSKESADRINKELFEPVIHNTAEQTRFMNEYSDTIDKLDLDKNEKYDWRDSLNKPIKIDEATVAQLLIEKQIDDAYLVKNNIDVDRIHNIANTFEKLLKDTVNRMDDVYVRFGYAPVEKRRNYFPHFLENKLDTFMSKLANAFGFKVGQEDLPTDIAGRTETFKPGRAFDRNILQRTTNKTDYNALKALDMYMQGASDIIYHTEDIQKLRAFNESIRDRFRTKEIQKKLDAINENIELTNEERFVERQKILEARKTPLNNLVTWIDEYTNVLANKKASADRQLEKDTSRQAYTTMKDIEGKIASNLIGGNFSVAITNFAPLSQAMGTTKTGDILIGMIQTTQNAIDEMIKGEGDSFVNESDFLTSRRGNDLTQKETFAQKFSNTISTPMELIDNFTSESIVRAKYRENMKNGMDHSEALKNADTYARNLMADRSKGAMPTVFSRTNPVAKLITAFQVEPNNIISNYFKDMPRDAKVNQQSLASQITRLSVASYAFNTILKSIRGGGDVIPNPIGIVSQLVALAIHNLDDDDENDEKISEVLGSIANDILGCIPAGSAIAAGGVAVGIDELQDNGKLMTSSAMPDFTKVAKLFDGNVSNDYKKQAVANELTKPLLYLGLPTGGAQLSKTAKGLYSYAKGGSYSYDKEGNKSLQFPVKHTPVNAIKSAVFGKYSLPQAQNYLDNNFDGMNAKETSLYEKTGIDFYELKDYFSKTKKVSQREKMEYADNMNVSVDNQWELYKYNVFSSKERDDGTSQVTDAEYAIKNKMATKKEYMKLYKEAEKNKIVFPNGEKLEELKNSNLNLSTYMKYQTEVKKATNEKKRSMLPVSDDSNVLSNKDKIRIIQSSTYKEEERRTIYANYIGKEDDTYNTLSKLQDGQTNIDAYLDYKLQDFTGDEDTSSNIVGKKVSKGTGSSKSKALEYINNSNLSDIEKMYIIETKYANELNDSQKSYILDLTRRKITNKKRLEEELKKFKDIEQHKDGVWYWK